MAYITDTELTAPQRIKVDFGVYGGNKGIPIETYYSKSEIKIVRRNADHVKVQGPTSNDVWEVVHNASAADGRFLVVESINGTPSPDLTDLAARLSELMA